jgi:hypothetical protein
MGKLKKINVIEFAKLHTFVFGFVGLVLGILYSFGGLIIDALVSLGWIVSQETPGLSYGTVLAFGALVGMPVIFGIIGLVVGVVVAVLYNLISWFGWGIDIKIK